MAPVPMMMPGGYSRSPSPRHPAPLIMQQGPHRRRSQSYSPRRRSYSPRYRRRSPPYERERDRSYDRDPHDRERPYDRDRHHGRRGYGPSRDESYSPSPLPRRRRPRSSDVSRSPSGYYAPTAPYPSMAPPPPSQYYSRRSPPYVEVIDIPQRPRRERSLSPTRPRRHSPSSREYDRSPPRDSRGQYLRRRLSPPDSRSLSPYTSPTRTRTRPLEEGAGPRGEEDRGGEMPPRRTTPRVGSPTPTSVPPRRAASGVSPTRSATPISIRHATPGFSPTRSEAPTSIPPRHATPGVAPTRSPITGPRPEEMTRPPIRVTVPSPTSRLPRGRAEGSPQVPISIVPATPIFPGERLESAEEPFRTPRHRPEPEELAEMPTTGEPVPRVAEPEAATPTARPRTSVFGYPSIEDHREQVEALNHVADRLQMTVALVKRLRTAGK
jgi:hypothetical protein